MNATVLDVELDTFPKLLARNAVKFANTAAYREKEFGKGDSKQFPGKQSSGKQSPDKKRRTGKRSEPDAGKERYRIEVGHQHDVKPGNIVGAIANEAGLDGEHIGHIEIGYIPRQQFMTSLGIARILCQFFGLGRVAFGK